MNEQDKYGQTPLIHALVEKKTGAAKFFIESGADITLRDLDGFDAFLWAVYQGNLEIIGLLLDKKADIESRSTSGWTSLMYAVSNGDHKAINLLLDKGANIEARDSLGWTPLMQTIHATDSVNTARLLIQRGADLNAKDKESKTPLILAMQNGNYKLADELKKEVSLRGDDSLIAKLIFIRESASDPPFRQDPHIYIGDYLIILEKNSTDFVDVKPGKCRIVIKGSILEGNHIVSFDAQAGKIYYFEVSVRTGNVASGILGGPIGWIIESKIAGEKAGLYEITPLEESAANEKINALQQAK